MLSTRFLKFSEDECRGSSDLYETLSIHVSKSTTLLDICGTAPVFQPVPNLFFGAVNLLLIKGYDDTLKEMYEADIESKAQLLKQFDDFCLKNKAEIIHIMKTHRVQTNEVSRTAYIYPILCLISQKQNKSLSLIEIGTSAGLKLLVDKYKYSFENSPESYGNKNSPLTIYSKVYGEFKHDLAVPRINHRIGIDLNILDLKNKHDYLWLQALIWPNHKRRKTILKEAKDILKDETLKLIEGDAVRKLKTISESIEKDDVLCIFHTHVANQMSDNEKKALIKVIEEIGNTRITYHIHNNIIDKKLRIDEYVDGNKMSYLVGKTEGHGRWFEWKVNQLNEWESIK